MRHSSSRAGEYGVANHFQGDREARFEPRGPVDDAHPAPAEFLVQLADQRLFGPLAGIELAAGKFPQPRELFAFGPLRDQHTVIGIDQRAGDNEGELDHER